MGKPQHHLCLPETLRTHDRRHLNYRVTSRRSRIDTIMFLYLLQLPPLSNKERLLSQDYGFILVIKPMSWGVLPFRPAPLKMQLRIPFPPAGISWTCFPLSATSNPAFSIPPLHKGGKGDVGQGGQAGPTQLAERRHRAPG